MKRLLAGLIVTVLLSGCGGGGGGTVASPACKGAVKTVAAILSTTSTGSGVFLIQSDDLTGVAGLDMMITYDTASLASPVVTQGSLVAGALMAANTNSPGSIKIAIISTKGFSGGGPIVQITFSKVTGPGGIKLQSVNLINSSGSAVFTGISSSAAPTGTPTSAVSTGIPSSAASTGTVTSVFACPQ